MKKIRTDRHEFTVVEEVPSGYQVWCIPTEGIEGYLPLAQSENWKVNIETLLAVKLDVETVDKIMATKMYLGTTNVEALKSYVEGNKNSIHHSVLYNVNIAKKGIPAIQKVKGLN